MARLWHRLVRLWHRLSWLDCLRWVALGLLGGVVLVRVPMVNVTISQDVLSDFAEDQDSKLALFTNLGDPRSPTRAYLDGLSAAVLPALARRDPQELADALDRAQGGRYAGVEPRFVILALPDGTILASSDARRFPAQSVVPDDLRRRFTPYDNGLKTEPGTDHAWLVRTLRTNGFRVGRLFAEVDIPGLERGRSLLRWSPVIGWVIGSLMTPLVLLGAYFVLKRLRKGIAHFQFFVYLGVGFLVISVAEFGMALVLKYDWDLSLIQTPLPFPLGATIGLSGVLFLLLGIALRKGMVLEGPHHGTAGRIAELACWTVIGLLLFASFNDLAWPFSSRGPQPTPANYKAIGLFEQADYPAAEEALKLGEKYYALGNYAAAAFAFNTAASKAGAFKAPVLAGNEHTRTIAPEAVLKLGMALARANEHTRTIMRYPTARYPTEMASEAVLKLGMQDACRSLAIVLGEYDDEVFPNAIAGNTSAGNAIKEGAEDEKRKLGC
jgi:hypothetical protein